MAKRGYNGLLIFIVNYGTAYALVQGGSEYSLYDKDYINNNLDYLLTSSEEKDIFSQWWDNAFTDDFKIEEDCE